MFEFIGKSDWAQQLRANIAQVAAHRSSVLVTGDSGTGKELIARAIHAGSKRADAPLVCVDCSSIPPSLFASTLFGHVKGAFSGADYDALGCFRAADGGTIFLDEIGELNLELQSQLLRVLQQREVIPVGSHRGVPVDIRIVAATNRNLAEEVRAGRFRQDLYYRLNVVRMETVPLDQRKDDIPALCEHFLAKLAIENGMPTRRLSSPALALLTAWHWPGNVRELQNVLERLIVYSPSETVGPETVLSVLKGETAAVRRDSYLYQDQPNEPAAPARSRFEFKDSQPGLFADDSKPLPTLAECEQLLIEAALRQAFYNQSRAARILRVDRKLLARKISKYKINLPTNANYN
jgi:DNA-binding NtrC family response regulator